MTLVVDPLTLISLGITEEKDTVSVFFTIKNVTFVDVSVIITNSLALEIVLNYLL